MVINEAGAFLWYPLPYHITSLSRWGPRNLACGGEGEEGSLGMKGGRVGTGAYEGSWTDGEGRLGS